MSLKAELETWVAALEAYDAQDYDRALSVFDGIAETSKIWFNMGLIYATLGEHERAVEHYKEATTLDEWFAVAAFQSGVSNFLLGRFKDAYADFDCAHQYMRDNVCIDYEQIGLKFRLYAAEIIFNRGLSMINMGRPQIGLSDVGLARTKKQTAEHAVIDEAWEAECKDYTVFSIPVGVVFRPSDAKIKNLDKVDYLGKARIVAASRESDAFVGFTGAERQAQQQAKLAAQELTNVRAALEAPSPRPPASPSLSRRPTDGGLAIPRAQQSRSPSPNIVARANTVAARGTGTGTGSDSQPSSPVVGSPACRLQRSDSLPTGTAGGKPAGSPLPGTPRLVQKANPFDKLAEAKPVEAAGSPQSGNGSGGSGSSTPVRDSSLSVYSLPPLPDDVAAPVMQAPLKLVTSATAAPKVTPVRAGAQPPAGPLPKVPEARDSMASLVDRYSDVAWPPKPEPAQQQQAPTAGKKAPPTKLAYAQQEDEGKPASETGSEGTRSPSVAIRSWLDKSSPADGGRAASTAAEPRSQPTSPTIARRPTLARKGSSAVQRSGTLRRGPSVRRRFEDKGYESDGAPSSAGSGPLERIRLKLHHDGEVRGLSIDADLAFAELAERVRAKFGKPALKMKFKDDDGALISLVDADDWSSAIDTAEDRAQGLPESKLDIYVE